MYIIFCRDQPNSIFKITFFYYTLFGAIMTVILGLIISYTSKSDVIVDRSLLSPIIYSCLSRKHDNKRNTHYSSIQGAIQGFD